VATGHSLSRNTAWSIIDVDIRSPEATRPALAAVETLLSDTPAVPIVLSGSGNGSRHLWFACPVDALPPKANITSCRLQGLAHPGYRHGFRSRSLRALGEIVRRGELISIGRASVLTRLVQAKRSELVTLVSAIAEVEGMTRADIREYLGLPLSPGDVVIR